MSMINWLELGTNDINSYFVAGNRIGDDNTDLISQYRLDIDDIDLLTEYRIDCDDSGLVTEGRRNGNYSNLHVDEASDDVATKFSTVNIPAIAAGRVIKRYHAQAKDEITLEVGDLVPVVDMLPVDETWWRGKTREYGVGYFPLHCIEIFRDKEMIEKFYADFKPELKRRERFIKFVRLVFRSRSSRWKPLQLGSASGRVFGSASGRVFGCDLAQRLASTGRKIPLILEMCVEAIQHYGIVNGMYRLSGLHSKSQRIKELFDNDEPPNLQELSYPKDIHCISSLLKTYFRELPNPLFTYELYEHFLSAIKIEDDAEKTIAFHHVIQRVPPAHYRTMDALLRHLNFCSQFAIKTSMTAQNLAIVWAPNVLKRNVDVGVVSEFRNQALILEYMIHNVDVFFDPDQASMAIAYYPEPVDMVPTATCEKATSLYNSPTTIRGALKMISLAEGTPQVTDTTKLRPEVEATNFIVAHSIPPSPPSLSLLEALARTIESASDSVVHRDS